MAFCTVCGAQAAENLSACPKCGAALPAGGGGAIAQSGAPEKTSGKAIASLVCSLFGLLLFPAIVAVILGHLSIRDISRSAGRLGGKGLALAGLILGYGAIAVMPILIVALTIPNLRFAKMRANEASALSTVNTLTQSCVEYSTAQSGFPHSLNDLVKAGFLPSQGFVDGQKADGSGESFSLLEKNGYRFAYSAGPPDASGAINHYTISADPVTQNVTGARRFFTDETAVIRATSDASPATANSPPLQ